MSTGFVYLIGGEDDAHPLQMIDAPNPYTCDPDLIELEDYRPATFERTDWAATAGRIFWALLTPPNVENGMKCVDIVLAGVKRQSRFALKIREGLRRIARALLAQRGIAA